MALFHGLPDFDPSKVHYAENEVARWVTNRAGINLRSPYLPGGRQLTWPELNQLNFLLGEGYGFNALIEQIGLPLRRNALTDLDEPIDRGPLHWVKPKAPGDSRAYLRVAVPREELLTTRDPRVVALTQTTFQYREERRNLLKTGKHRLKADGAASVVVSSGTRPTLAAIENLMSQRQNFLQDEGVRMIFDLETASLFPEHGIRQLSYRMVNKAGELVSAPRTINLKNSIMGLGYFTEDIDAYTQRMGRDGIKIGQQPADIAAEELTEFFEQAGRSRYLIGQNAMFDVGMLEDVKKSRLYVEGQRLIDEHGAGVSKLTGRDAEAVRLFRAANSFFEKAYSADFVDTAAHARMLMSEVDQVRLAVAPEILRRGEAKLFSIENIILQSSFIQDIMDRNLASREELQAIFGGKGLHQADIDTWFTDMLSRLESIAYADGTTPGSPVLRAEALAKQTVELIMGPGADVEAFRNRISAGAAITPFTNLPMDMLNDMVAKGWMTPEELEKVGQGTAKVSGIQKMILATRKPDLVPNAELKFSEVAGNTGLFSRFLQERGILTDEGFLQGGALLPDVEEWGAFQAQLARAGYAAPGQAFAERLVTHIFATSPGVGTPAEQQMRRIFGETMGTTEWVATREISTYPRKRAPRSVAIPLEDLQQIARELSKDGLIDGTRLGEPFGGKGVQWMGISPFQYRTWWGKTVEDVSLTVRGLISEDSRAAEAQINRIIGWLQEHRGIGQAEADRIAHGLRATGATTGIQVATLTGARGSPAATAAYNIAKHLGLDVDRAGTGMMTPLLVPPPEGALDPGRIMTGAFRESVLGRIFRPEEQDTLLNETARQIQMQEAYANEIAPDARFMLEHDRQGLGFNYGHKQGAEAAADRFGDWITNIPDRYARLSTNVKVGTLGAVAALGLGAYYMRKRKESREAGEALQVMPYEYGGSYNRYREDLDLAMLSSAEIARSTRNRDPLATASVPAYLDGNRKRSYQMNTAAKNNHLFGDIGGYGGGG